MGGGFTIGTTGTPMCVPIRMTYPQRQQLQQWLRQRSSRSQCLRAPADGCPPGACPTPCSLKHPARSQTRVLARRLCREGAHPYSPAPAGPTPGSRGCSPCAFAHEGVHPKNFAGRHPADSRTRVLTQRLRIEDAHPTARHPQAHIPWQRRRVLTRSLRREDAHPYSLAATGIHALADAGAHPASLLPGVLTAQCWSRSCRSRSCRPRCCRSRSCRPRS